MASPIFPQKGDDLFSPHHHSHPLRLPSDRLFSSILSKYSRKNIYTFIKVSPLDGVTRGGPPLVTPL